MRKSLGLALLCSVALGVSVAAGPEKLQYDLAFGTVNPCNGLIATAPGEVKISVTQRNDSTLDVKFGFRGNGTDTAGGEYRVAFEGAETFGTLTSPLAFTFTGAFIGKQAAPSFNLSGSIQVFVDGAGVPFDAFIGASSFVCTGN